MRVGGIGLIVLEDTDLSELFGIRSKPRHINDQGSEESGVLRIIYQL